jgi:hypothetical protein
MSDDKPPTSTQLSRLMGDVQNQASVPVGAHLDDDALVDYSMQAISAEDVARMDEHLASCEQCSVRMAHLADISEAWRGATGDARLEALSARVRHAIDVEDQAGPSPVGERVIGAVRGLWSRADWNRRIQTLRLGADSLAKSLTMTPSALHFGGTPDAAAPVEAGLFAAGEPTAFSCSALFMRNGRELPEAAEIYWGHEIWLVQVPCVLLHPHADCRSIGLVVGFPDQDVEVIDVAPRPVLVPGRAELLPPLLVVDLGTSMPLRPESPSLSSGGPSWPMVLDLGWNGSMTPPDLTVALTPSVQDLGFDSGVQLAVSADLIGRLSSPVLACPVESAAAGFREAWFVFAADSSLREIQGNIWLTVVADKFAPDLTIRLQPWTTIRGLNGVPARLAGEALIMPVRKVDSVDEQTER